MKSHQATTFPYRFLFTVSGAPRKLTMGHKFTNALFRSVGLGLNGSAIAKNVLSDFRLDALSKLSLPLVSIIAESGPTVSCSSQHDRLKRSRFDLEDKGGIP